VELMIEFHKLFGLSLMDMFTDSYYDVELEKNLALQEQFLDMIILKKSEGKPPRALPDGFENLSTSRYENRWMTGLLMS